MSAETTKVDVIAVMDEHIDTAQAMVATQGNLYGAEDLLKRAKEARAAVAELIEVADEFHMGVQTHIDGCEHCEARNERMRKVIARARGKA